MTLKPKEQKLCMNSMQRLSAMLVRFLIRIENAVEGIGCSLRNEKQAIIQIAFGYNFEIEISDEEKMLVLFGVYAHELLHLLLTDFSYAAEQMRKYNRRDQHYRHTFANVVEDAAIEYQRSDRLSSFLNRALDYSISYFHKVGESLGKQPTAFAELVTALIQFGDLGYLKGYFAFKEAEECYFRIIPIMQQAIEEPDFKKRFELSQDIYEIAKVLIPKHEEQLCPQNIINQILQSLGKSLESQDNKGQPLDSGSAGQGSSSSEKSNKANEMRKKQIHLITKKQAEEMGLDKNKGKASSPEEATDIFVVVDDDSDDKNADGDSSPSQGGDEKISDDTKDSSGGKADKNQNQDGESKSGTSGASKETEASKDGKDSSSNNGASGKGENKSDNSGSAEKEDGASGSAGSSEEGDEKSDKNGSSSNGNSSSKESSEENGSSSGADNAGTGEEKNSSGENGDGKSTKGEPDSQNNGDNGKNSDSSNMNPFSGMPIDISISISGNAESSGQNAHESDSTNQQSTDANQHSSESENTFTSEGSEYVDDNSTAKKSPDTSSGPKKDMGTEVKELNEELSNEAKAAEDAEALKQALSDIGELIADEIKAEERQAKLEKKGSKENEIDLTVESPFYRNVNYRNDRIETENEREYRRIMDEEMRRRITNLSASLKPIFNSPRGSRHYKTSGKISIERTATERPTARLFYKDSKPKNKADMSMVIFVDESGSMGGATTRVREVVALLLEALLPFNIKVKVVGFTTESSCVIYRHYGKTLDWENSKSLVKTCMNICATGGTFLGHALRYTGAMLKNRTEANRLFVCITDGNPQWRIYRDASQGIKDCREAVTEIKKYADVIGVGLYDDKDSEEVFRTIFQYGAISMSDIDALVKNLPKRLKKVLRGVED